MRKITKPLAVMGMLAPLSVNALGVGEIELRSALNQNLVAEIPLLTSPSEKPADIRVRLASPYAFSKAGIDRHYFLTGLRFNTEVKQNGAVVINVSSRDAVREPFLNFLIEVNWPQGQMLREFTLLLDPPSTFAQQQQALTNLPVTTSSPAESNTSAQPTARPQAGSSVRQEAQFTGDSYGPTENKDTLWDIASKLKQGTGVTHEQMMMALRDANPEAFYGSNVNRLKVGEVLKKPTQAQLARYTPSQARQAFRQQYEDWKSGKTSTASPSSPAPAPRQEATTTVAADSTTTADTRELELVTPDAETVKAISEGGVEAVVRTNPDLASEVVETLRQENTELRDRLEEMELQLQTTQKLLDVQSEQLALIQNERIRANISGEDALATAESGIDSPAATTTGKPGAGSLAMAAEADAESAGGQQLAGEAGQKVVDEELAGNQAAEKKTKRKPAPPVVQQEEPFWADYMDPVTLSAGGFGLSLLMVAGIWLRRRKQAQLEPLQDTAKPVEAKEAPATIAAGQIATGNVEAHSGDDFLANQEGGYDSGIIAESSFLSEFTPGDFDSDDNESDEIDPVAEADVYLAYGRYSQAEELIRTALENTPDRNECKLKLLEIFQAAENAEGFRTYARQLDAAGDSSDQELWDKVTEMGKIICPDEPLFGGEGPAAAETPDVSSEAVADAISQPDAEAVSSPENEPEFPAVSAGEVADRVPSAEDARGETDDKEDDIESFDFSDLDLGLGDVEEDITATDEVDEIDQERSLDFDLAELSSLTDESSADDLLFSGAATDEAAELQGNEMEFEGGISGNAVDPQTADSDDTEFLRRQADEVENMLTGHDLDSGVNKSSALESFSELDLSSDKDAAVDSIEDDDMLLLDDLPLEDISASSEAGAVEELPGVDAEGEYQGNDVDDIETKLDLAKAYVDMSDHEAAADMLAEVKEQGNPEQLREAEALLQQLENSSSRVG